MIMSTPENKHRLIGRVGQRSGWVCGDKHHIHIYYRPCENITLPHFLVQKGREYPVKFLLNSNRSFHLRTGRCVASFRVGVEVNSQSRKF